jgi:hypothetical protein
MVLDQGWAHQDQQETNEEEEEAVAPVDISDSIGSDFTFLPESEIRYIPKLRVERGTAACMGRQGTVHQHCVA